MVSLGFEPEATGNHRAMLATPNINLLINVQI